MIRLYLVRREPEHNRQRFYSLIVTRTLFDGWALIREWGRLGQSGTVREDWYETRNLATAAAFKIVRQKEKRGYILVSREGDQLIPLANLVFAAFSVSIQTFLWCGVI